MPPLTTQVAPTSMDLRTAGALHRLMTASNYPGDRVRRPRLAGDLQNIPPRLLTLEQVAHYLSLPLAAARRLDFGRRSIAGHLRFDRHAIDAHLDGESANLPNPVPANDDPEAALARFLERTPTVARRSPGS